MVEESPRIGLKRGTVGVVPYDDEWATIFTQEEHRLREHIGPIVLDIQHVGSTAVPGLAAKPIIDIAIAVSAREDIARCQWRLTDLGYLDRGDARGDGGYLFVKECDPDVRTHYLHLVTRNDPQWRNYLRFRDRLRTDTELRAEYVALKRQLQARFTNDLRAYTAAKDAFIRRVLE